MRTLLLLAVASVCLGMVGAMGVAAPEGKRRLVVVELFTSEGCSSCPPADVLLKELVEKQSLKGVEVVGVGWHVDYWDGLGWKDPFSSAAATARQREYVRAMKLRSAYTPQAVVEGKWEGVGSDERQVRGAIAAAVAQQRGELGVKVEGAEVIVTVPAEVSGKLEVIVTEAGLTTAVRRGENAGRELAQAPVVRRVVSGGDAAAGEMRVAVKLEPEWRRENLKVVALVVGDKREIAAAGVSGVR